MIKLLGTKFPNIWNFQFQKIPKSFGVKNVQKGSADREGSLWWDGSYGISELGFFGCVACVLGFFLGVIILITNLTSIMQIAIAPKIWLLEYAADLVK